jgi:outer membrane lipoprotein-sorting protein
MKTLLFLLLALAPSAHAVDGVAILRQVDANMWPDSYEMYRKLINVDSDGSRREYVMYTVKKGRDKVVNLFLAPAEELGRVMLRVGDTMWLQFPDVPQALRVSGMQSVVGGIFNNWDLMRSSFSLEYEVESSEEEPGAYALSLKALSKWAVYDRLKLWVDKQHMLPQKLEVLTPTGVLIKTLTFNNIKDFGDGVVRPSVVETESPLWPGVKAVMLFAEIRKREFADEVFTVNYMPRIGDLRH